MTVGALELGGSHVSAARVDLSTARLDRAVRMPLEPHAARSALLAAIRDAARSMPKGVLRIGVAAPGPFDYENGVCTIQGVGKLEALFGVDLRSELSRVFPDAPPRAIHFLNDAEAFLLGEGWAGAARGHTRAIGITLGTGLGSAFLADGEIVREGLGVPPEGNLHRVSFRGRPVEDAISGRGIRSRVAETAGVQEIAERADRGDPQAIGVLAAVGSDLGEFLTPWCAEFRATVVVVGGSIARAWDHFAEALAQSLSVEAVVAERLDDAALLGAALHASRDGNPSE